MRKGYHKFIRDRIPEIIRQSGERAEVVVLNESDYQQALRQELVEEDEASGHGI